MLKSYQNTLENIYDNYDVLAQKTLFDALKHKEENKRANDSICSHAIAKIGLGAVKKIPEAKMRQDDKREFNTLNKTILKQIDFDPFRNRNEDDDENNSESSLNSDSDDDSDSNDDSDYEDAKGDGSDDEDASDDDDDTNNADDDATDDAAKDDDDLNAKVLYVFFCLFQFRSHFTFYSHRKLNRRNGPRQRRNSLNLRKNKKANNTRPSPSLSPSPYPSPSWKTMKTKTMTMTKTKMMTKTKTKMTTKKKTKIITRQKMTPKKNQNTKDFEDDI